MQCYISSDTMTYYTLFVLPNCALLCDEMEHANELSIFKTVYLVLWKFHERKDITMLILPESNKIINVKLPLA